MYLSSQKIHKLTINKQFATKTVSKIWYDANQENKKYIHIHFGGMNDHKKGNKTSHLQK